MLYRDNEILIFDEPTAVLTPQEIDELMEIMRGLRAEGKSILFITHKLNEIMAVADRCTVLRKGKYIGTVDVAHTTKEEPVQDDVWAGTWTLWSTKEPAKPGDVVLDVKDLTVASKVHKNNAVKGVSFQARAGEIVCIAGIDGNGQSELVYGLTGIEPVVSGTITFKGQDITNAPIRKRVGLRHEPTSPRTGTSTAWCWTTPWEDNMVLQRYFEPEFVHAGFMKRKAIRAYAERLIQEYDVRSGQGPHHPRPAACPAATSRRPSWPVRSTRTRICSSPSSPPAAWTWAPSSTSTARSWPSGTPARPSSWSAGAGRGSWR